jgi:thiol-disulfide isomerase/thioredoxin
MKFRGVWLILGFLAMMLIVPANTVVAESINKVAKIDSDGIRKLVEESNRTIIVGMAAWCFPCRQELPILLKLYNKYKDKGLSVIGVSVDINGPEAIQPTVDEEKVNFPVYWGGEPAIKALKMVRLPLLLFLKDGKIVDEVVGKQKEEVLDEKIRVLLKP